MISLKELSIQRGGKPLLDQADCLIHAGQRVGVIGANGCGKSSLFQLLLGRLTPDSGDVSIPKQMRMAHMAQEVTDSDRTALDYVLDGDSELRDVERQILTAQQQDDNDALAGAYAQLDAIHGHSAQSRAQQLLHGLGFHSWDGARMVREFSGGWRIRLNLAQALMCPSDILLLDEPTNHLDLDATLWLEQWLLRYPGTLLLISHDRDFLDNVATHVIHFNRRNIDTYRGNYSAYEQQRGERLAQQQAQYKKQQQEIEDIHRFVNRFKAKATKAKQAQSRLKALARMDLIAPAHVDSPFSFRFADISRQSDPLLKLEQARLGYDGEAVLSNLNLGIPAGARIGLLGPNGAGKSTLIKSLVGELALLSGERVTGENLDVGYYAQHQMDALDPDASPLLHIQRISPAASEQSIRNFLGGFDFHGDAATGSIVHFSGGEKARLALAIVVWQKPNLLIMDEPTNHLDLEMCHALTVALQGFTGALILVSHDRHLLRNSVDEFLLVAEGAVKPFEEDLDYYQQWLMAGKRAERSAREVKTKQQDRKAERQEAARLRDQVRPLTQKLKQIERQMDANGRQCKKIEARLLETGLYQASGRDELQALVQEQGRLKRESEALEEDWLSISTELEEIGNKA